MKNAKNQCTDERMCTPCFTGVGKCDFPADEKNQCDGCAVGAPLTERGHHHMPDGGYMGCSKDLYLGKVAAWRAPNLSGSGETWAYRDADDRFEDPHGNSVGEALCFHSHIEWLSAEINRLHDEIGALEANNSALIKQDRVLKNRGPCVTELFSSRACVFGTRGCVADHDLPRPVIGADTIKGDSQ